MLAGLFALDAVFSGLQGYLMGKTGDLLSRAGTDTTLLKATLAQSLTSVVVGVMIFVGASLLMAVIDLLLLTVALACVAVAATIVLFVATKVRASTRNSATEGSCSPAGSGRG